MILFDDFLFRAALAGIGVALAAGPLGAFVVWRRMAYFGDATAHAAILGVAISLALSMPIMVGVLITVVTMALYISQIDERVMSSDTALGVASHAALAMGLVAVSLLDIRVDLMAYLFGDILGVSMSDIVVIWGGSSAVLAMLIWRWTPLLTATLNPDLARAHGGNPRREVIILTLALALIVALAIKTVGALLITAMLIIPATAAGKLANSPEAMAAYGSVIGAVSTVIGLGLSLNFDTPPGPSIVLASLGIFILVTIFGKNRTA